MLDITTPLRRLFWQYWTGLFRGMCVWELEIKNMDPTIWIHGYFINSYITKGDSRRKKQKKVDGCHGNGQKWRPSWICFMLHYFRGIYGPIFKLYGLKVESWHCLQLDHWWTNKNKNWKKKYIFHSSSVFGLFWVCLSVCLSVRLFLV